jgi:putative ABC transport system ATP-binding protein
MTVATMTATIPPAAGIGAAPPPMFRLDDVSKSYRTERIETTALDRVNLTIERGEFVAIMGPSGCGKTTLLNLMGLLDVPSRGQVEVDGAPVVTRRDAELAKLRNEKVGFIFQSFHLIPDLPVLDNVQLPLLYRRMGGNERRRLALAALDRVGLASRVHHFPPQLSGGQQQRVAVARALVGRPHALLADEPTGNLDSAMGDEILGLLEEVNQAGTTVVMVTHDPRMAEKAHRVVRLFDGRQVQ